MSTVNELPPAESRRAVVAWKLGNKAASAVREGLAVIKQREDAARIGPCRKCGETCFDSLCELCADLDSVKDAIAHEIAQMATVGPKGQNKGENGHRAAVDGASQHFRIPSQPIGKPRMTRSDKWQVRDCVAQYRAWADRARASCPGIMAAPGRLNFTAYLAMPPSWSRKKKAAMTGQPHRQKPDVDNIAKAVMDALWKDDSGIHSISCSKLWCDCERAGIELHVEV